MGTALTVAAGRWNNGEFPTQTGEHRGLRIFDDQVTKIDSGYGELVEVELWATLYVSEITFLTIYLSRKYLALRMRLEATSSPMPLKLA